MKRPTVKGFLGALVAVGAVALATVLPRTLSEAPHFGPAAPAQPPDMPSTVGSASAAEPGSSPARPPPAAKKMLDRLGWIRELSSTLAERMPSLPAPERRRLADVIYREARAASLDPLFVLAVIAVESGFDHVAESGRGARGLMQLRPETAQREAERANLEEADLDDPIVNVQVGIRYYRRLLSAFGSPEVALMAYNAGPNRIRRHMEESGEIPHRFQVYPTRVNRELTRLRRRHARRAQLARADRVPAVRPGGVAGHGRSGEAAQLASAR